LPLTRTHCKLLTCGFATPWLIANADHERRPCWGDQRGRRTARSSAPAAGEKAAVALSRKTVVSVASVFVSHWDSAADALLPRQLHGKLGVAIMRQIYASYRNLLASDRRRDRESQMPGQRTDHLAGHLQSRHPTIEVDRSKHSRSRPTCPSKDVIYGHDTGLPWHSARAVAAQPRHPASPSRHVTHQPSHHLGGPRRSLSRLMGMDFGVGYFPTHR
jgi:hypothetical protein